ncbi:uncharacterized protein LOC131929581 [Physella acuta]|uniref:uncharacterized protein LOC131929581 n=1 Tax=Physella acuta TaxID=109671 RepID=UPI0027DD57ED|nr:uncharacterized protein LOC131929581 [Physella acuta]
MFDVMNRTDHLAPASSDVTSEFVPQEILITNANRRLLEIIIDLTLNFILSLLGVFTNVLVIMVYARQGFKDSVGISMTTISIWDLIKSLGGVMQRMAGPISLWSESSAVTWTNICLVVFNYLVSFSTYVTSVLAGYVAIERCLCVVFPLTIKHLLTRRVCICVCILVSLVVFGWFAVIFGIYDVFWVWDPTLNASIAVYQYSQFSKQNTALLFGFYNLSGALWPMVSLVVIVISAFVMSVKLRQSREFRNGTKKPEADNQLSNKSNPTNKPITSRDRKVMKMLLIIIALYVINLSPRVIHYMAKYMIEEYYFLRTYHNLVHVVSYVILFFDFMNGSVNLFVFLTMSTSFKTTFYQMVPCCGTVVI